MITNFQLFEKLYELFSRGSFAASNFFAIVANNDPHLIDLAIQHKLSSNEFAMTKVVSENRRVIIHKAVPIQLNIRTTPHDELGRVYFQLTDPTAFGYNNTVNGLWSTRYKCVHPQYKITFVKAEFSLDDTSRFLYNCEITFDVVQIISLIPRAFNSIFDYFAEDLSKNLFNVEKSEANLFNNCIRLEMRGFGNPDELLIQLKSSYSLSELFLDVYYHIFGSIGERLSTFFDRTAELDSLKCKHKRELVKIAAKYEQLIAHMRNNSIVE